MGSRRHGQRADLSKTFMNNRADLRNSGCRIMVVTKTATSGISPAQSRSSRNGRG